MPPPIVFLLLTLSTTIAPTWSIIPPPPPPPHPCNKPQNTPCPPFLFAPPPFPFSASPGCGHPAFQLKCAIPHSTLSINNLSFSLLQFQPNSSTLLLSPYSPSSFLSTSSTTRTKNKNCSSHLYIPSRSINLSASPFRLSNSYCSHLTSLTPCSLPSNCTQCPFECDLAKNPLNLLINGCDSSPNKIDNPGICQNDVLGYLDRFLSNGFEVEYDQSSDSFFTNCKQCSSRNGICGFNSSDPGKTFICFGNQSNLTRTPTRGLSPPWIHGDNPHRLGLFSSVFASFCLVLVVATVLVAVCRYNRLKSSTEDQTASFLHRHRSPNLLPPVFAYEDLAISTNGFDPKRKIGDGGFGSVYLGQLKDHRVVAVKYLHKQHRHQAKKGAAFSTKSFCNEILILSSLNHPNLVKLHGYCSDPRGLILVYDYVPNGTLADHLHNNKGSSPMTWQVRLDVALQTVLALEYLHFSVTPAVVHRDVTSSNIFMERDMRVKLGDFGLSRLLVCNNETSSSGSAECVLTGPQGTPGYLDPDYHKSFRLTEKSDVYSFGVILWELVSGLRAVDGTRDRREVALADLVVSKIQMGLLHQVVDSGLVAEGVLAEGVGEVAELAFRCVAADKDDRPDSKEVVEELKRIRNRTRGTTRAPRGLG